MSKPCLALLVAAFFGVATVHATDAPATFVGAAACAGCHAAETEAWHGSQHDQAMQEATPATVLGDFADATITQFGVTSRFYRKGDELLRRDGRARTGPARLPDRLHVRRLPAAAVPGRLPGRALPGAEPRLGRAAEGAGRPALVPPLSRREDRARRRAALDRDQSELELDVRRLPLDQSAARL